MPQPSTHYFHVRLDLSGLAPGTATLKMATWTPGSYLIREYARNVEEVAATSGGKPVPVLKQTKNTWLVSHGKATQISVFYRVYANELAVRNAYLDAGHGYINGAAVFLWVKGQEDSPARLRVNTGETGFTQVVTALKEWKAAPGKSGYEASDAINPGSSAPGVRLFQIGNLDELIDSPILIGNPRVMEFEASGVPHRVAFQGPGNMNEERIRADFSRIVTTAAGIFGHHPCDRYTFLVHNLPTGGGGLEHGHSTSLQTSWNTYDSESSYQNFLGLVAHEYFHLWNVKRLRPRPLGPFDYENENYTRLLWFAEGFTSYYDDFILFRSGITPQERFLDVVASNLSRVETVPGMYAQNLAEASLDAWIKYYRPNENSGNSQADYYTKGAAMATLLDWLIIRHTDGKKNLDDLMKGMYREYYLRKNTGFSEEDLEKELVAILGPAGKTFLGDYIYDVKKPDWSSVLADFGFRLTDRNAGSGTLTAGFRLQSSGGKMVVQSIPSNGPAWTSGIHVGDEILAIGDQRIESPDLHTLLSNRKAGEKVQILYARSGQVMATEIGLQPETARSYKLERTEKPSARAEMLRKKWLRLE